MVAETIVYIASRDFPNGVALDSLDKTIKDLKLGANYDGSRYDATADKVFLDFLAKVGEIDRARIDGSTVLPVHDVQTDETLDPRENPIHGDRYIISDTTNMHPNFGTIQGVDDWDIVEYQADTDTFEIVFNASAEETGRVQNHDDHWLYEFNGVQWIPGSAAGVIADHDGQRLPNPAAHVILDSGQDALPVREGKAKKARSILLFGPDLTRKDTWYYDAIRVENETPAGTIDGSNKVFTLDCGGDNEAFVLDLYGKLTNVLALKPHPSQTPDEQWGEAGGYLPVVAVDGVPLKMVRPHRDESSEFAKGYGYSINSETRTITFKDAPAASVSVTYWYVPKNAVCHLLRLSHPPEGKKWTVDYVETQFSEDIDYNDTIIFGAYPVDKFWFPLQPELHYTTMHEIDDYAMKSSPTIPASGAHSNTNNTRGSKVDKHLKYWLYIDELSVDNTSLVEIMMKEGFGTFAKLVFGMLQAAPDPAAAGMAFNAAMSAAIPFGGSQEEIVAALSVLFETKALEATTTVLTFMGLEPLKPIELNARLEEGIAFGGERSTITVRVLEEDID